MIAPVPRTRILVVDDDPGIVRAVTRVFGQHYDVRSAAGGAAALVVAADFEPDVAIVDIRMPEMDGFEATQKILTSVNRVAPPIVALTANTFEDDRQVCLASGMDDFLVKPLTADALRRILSQVARGWNEPAGRRR